MNVGHNIGCACRFKSKWRPPALPIRDTSKKGDDAVNYIIGLIHKLKVWEVTKMREGTQADLAVRKGADGFWLPVQVKSCSTGKGCFPHLKGYDNMVLCLVELNSGKGGEFWLGRRDDFPSSLVKNIRGKRYKDRYERFRVLDASDLNDRLRSFDTDSYIRKRPLDYLNVPSHWAHRKEHLSQTLFRAVLASFGHTMSFPNYENSATDWFLNGRIAVQDKTVGWKSFLQYIVPFKKSNGSVDGKKQCQPYAPGDNDLYILFVLDQDYNKSDLKGSADDFMVLAKNASLRGCYMFREADLLATGHIATASQTGKITLQLPVPNADGTFESGMPRTHNMQPYYFHKTNFKALIGAMM